MLPAAVELLELVGDLVEARVERPRPREVLVDRRVGQLRLDGLFLGLEVGDLLLEPHDLGLDRSGAGKLSDRMHQRNCGCLHPMGGCGRRVIRQGWPGRAAIAGGRVSRMRHLPS
jgi:hypothetical protein